MRAGGMTDVFVGRVVKAFGIRGELKLVPTGDFWEGVLDSKNLVVRRRTDTGIEERAFVVERYRPHGKCYVVVVSGVTDRDEAEGLVGSEIFIDASRVDVDLPDEKLPFQVVGARVRDVEGRNLGEVTAVLFSPAHDLYEVTGENGAFMVPAVSEFVVAIDDEKREIIIKTIPGLVNEENEK